MPQLSLMARPACTHSITKKTTKNCRQVHTIEHTHKQLFTFRYVLRQCTLMQVLVYGFALFLAQLREGPETIFGVITLAHVLSQKKPAKNCRQVHTIEDAKKKQFTFTYSAPDAWDRFTRQTLFFSHFYTSTRFLLALWKDRTELNQE